MIPLHFSLILAQPFHDTMPFSSRVGSFGKLIIDAIRAEYIYIYIYGQQEGFCPKRVVTPKKEVLFRRLLLEDCTPLARNIIIRSTLINARSDVCRDGG